MVDHRDLARLRGAGSGPWCAGRPAPIPWIGDGARRRACARRRRAISADSAGIAARGRTRLPASSSSAAWRRACDGVADAGEHARQLARPARHRRRPRPSATVRSSPPAVAQLHGLLHHDLRVGERRHLREVRDAQHLVARPERREQTPDRDPGLTADPGVDLVEHQRRRRLREHHARRQHRTGELAAGRGPGQRPGRLARVGRQQEGHPVVRRRRWARPARPRPP